MLTKLDIEEAMTELIFYYFARVHRSKTRALSKYAAALDACLGAVEYDGTYRSAIKCLQRAGYECPSVPTLGL